MPELQYNYILATAVLSWLAAQVIKTLLYFVFNKRFRAERLYGAGGMPSAHSAMVCSAVAAVGRECGGGSPEFAITLIFALIVMYDAMGVRRAAGVHAKEINRMNDRLFTLKDLFSVNLEEEDEDDKTGVKQLKEYLGHTPFEVIGGVILGIIMAFVVPTQI